jgi:hypothetical protein
MPDDGLSALDAYLSAAAFVSSWTFPRPGQHRSYVIVLEGGVGVLAKPEDAPGLPEAPAMVRREAAAWVIARYLDWADLVSGARLRLIPSPSGGGSDVYASLHVLWPNSAPDLDAPFSDDEQWRAAIFDALVGQTDRAGHNWLAVPDPAGGGAVPPRLALVDHGNSMRPGVYPPASTFYMRKAGQKIPDEHLAAIDGLLRQMPGDLTGLIDAAEIGGIGDRGYALRNKGVLQLP